MADVRVVGHDREVAGHLELIAAAHAGAVDARDGRLADVAQPIVHLDEGAHPAPVLAAGGAHRRLLVEIGASAEGAVARTSDDDHGDRLVPGGLLKGARQLAEGGEVEGVHHLRPIDGDRRHPKFGFAAVPDALGLQAGGVGGGRRRGRLRHRPRRTRPER
jgi:hypothetical protein